MCCTVQFKLDRTQIQVQHGLITNFLILHVCKHVCARKHFFNISNNAPYNIIKRTVHCKTAAFHCLQLLYLHTCSSHGKQVWTCDMHLSCVMCVQSWGCYFQKVTSYLLLVTFRQCNILQLATYYCLQGNIVANIISYISLSVVKVHICMVVKITLILVPILG